MPPPPPPHEVHEVTLHYIRPNSRNFHHSQLDHHWSNIYTVQKSHLESTQGDFKGLCRVVPSTPQCHLMHIFSPHIHILTSHTHSHLAYIFSSRGAPPPLKVTSHTHSHLAYTFSPHVHILTLRAPATTQSPHAHLAYTFSPRIHILTSRTYSHLACPSTTQSHLMPTSRTHSHLTYIFSPHMLPSTQNNIFHLAWKNSQKSHVATPIPSIRYLLRATNNLNFIFIITGNCRQIWSPG